MKLKQYLLCTCLVVKTACGSSAIQKISIPTQQDDELSTCTKTTNNDNKQKVSAIPVALGVGVATLLAAGGICGIYKIATHKPRKTLNFIFSRQFCDRFKNDEDLALTDYRIRMTSSNTSMCFSNNVIPFSRILFIAHDVDFKENNILSSFNTFKDLIEFTLVVDGNKTKIIDCLNGVAKLVFTENIPVDINVIFLRDECSSDNSYSISSFKTFARTREDILISGQSGGIKEFESTRSYGPITDFETMLIHLTSVAENGIVPSQTLVSSDSLAEQFTKEVNKMWP